MLALVRYAGYLSGIDYMAVTRLDILDTFDEIKMCVAYKYNGEILDEMPASLKLIANVEPVYETFAGWKRNIVSHQKIRRLPENARKIFRKNGAGYGYWSWICFRRSKPFLIILHDVF